MMAHHRETLTVPADLARRGNNYVLRVKGNSMEGEGVRDGDYLIVNQCSEAQDGEMALVNIRRSSVPLLRRYARVGLGTVRLTSDEGSADYAARDVTITGSVVGLIRKY